MNQCEFRNAVSVVLLLAQGCQTIVQATLGSAWFAWNNAVSVVPFRCNPPFIHVCIDINRIIK